MENKNKYLWILTLISLVLGSSTFSSYGKNQNGETIVIKEQKELRMDPIKITGGAEVAAAHSILLDYPAKTDFTPSLIHMKSTGNELVNAVSFDTGVKLGFETKFYVNEQITKAVLQFAADAEAVKLSKLYFETGGWSIGLKENNFCNIAVFKPVKVVLLGWTKEFNSNITLGISAEQSKKFALYPTKKEDVIKKSELQPREDLPAASARVEYKLADKFGCIEVSGLARPLGTYNKNTSDTEYKLGYGVNLGTKLNLVHKVDKLTFNAVFGEAIGNYVRDLKEMAEMEENTAYVKITPAGKKETVPLRSVGAHLCYEHRWTPAFRSIIGGGITTILNGEDKEDDKKRPNAYFMGWYGTAKLMYYPIKGAGLGVEYGIGMRTNSNETTSPLANHIKALVEFKF